MQRVSVKPSELCREIDDYVDCHEWKIFYKCATEIIGSLHADSRKCSLQNSLNETLRLAFSDTLFLIKESVKFLKGELNSELMPKSLSNDCSPCTNRR